MPVHSTNRLRTLVSLVPSDARMVADVGYDHGQLIGRLLRARRELRAIGVEEQPVCRGRFMRQNRGSWVERVVLREGSGLEPIEPGEADVLVIAGVGERKTAQIVKAAAAVVQAARRLIVCPADLRGTLRAELAGAGVRVGEERIAMQRRRFYETIAFEPGQETCDDELGPFFGPHLLARRDPALLDYLLHLRRTLQAARRAIRARGIESWRDLPSPAEPTMDALERWRFERKVMAVHEALERFGSSSLSRCRPSAHPRGSSATRRRAP